MTTQHNSEERHGLFRQQAVKKQQDRLLGDVLVVPPLSYMVVTAIVSLFVAAGAVLLLNGTYARKETVQGYLTPDKGIVKVFANTSGIVREVFVEEGDSVEEGQPLLVVNGDRVLENGNSLEETLLNEYRVQQQLLNKKLSQLPLRIENRHKELQRQRDQAKNEIHHLYTRQAILDQQLVMANQQLDSLTSLYENGLASRTEFDIAKEKNLSLKVQQQELLRDLDTQESTLSRLNLNIGALSFEEENEKIAIQDSLSSLAQEIAHLHGRRAYIVKAGQAGRISNIQIATGQEASTNKPLLGITPEGSQLIAELMVPARAIGFVEPGLSIKLRYSAYSYQKFGLYDAMITEVSQSALLPEELKGVLIGVQEPMYRVTASLARQEVDAYGKSLPLKEGIALEADIELSERTLIEWLLEPLFSLKGRL